MKKLILLAMAIYCFGFISAQTETKLFTGDTTPSLFSRIDFVSWGMGDAANNYVNYGTADAPAFTEVATNPDKTGLNATDKALHLTSLKGHSWWPDFLDFTLTAPITITADNRYLHIYHFRENLNKGFSVNINNEKTWDDPDKGTKRFDSNLTTAGKWEDVVVDLKWFMDNNEPLSMFCVLMDTNWGADAEPTTNYYFDEIVLNNSNLPRGLNILPDTEMSLFYGNTASYNKWVKSIDTQNTENAYSIVANPFTTQTAVLNSAQVVKFDKSANAAWWQGFRTLLPGVFKVNDGKQYYLHVMVNIPTMDPAQDPYIIQLNAKDFAGNQLDSGDFQKYFNSDAGNWMDMVLDVTSLGYIQEFTVRCDVRKDANDAYINSPAGTFYIDAVSIDTNPDPRTTVTAPNAVNNPNQNNLKVYSANHNVVVEGNAASVEVYNMLGKSLNKATATGSKTVLPVSQGGVYLVKTTTADGNVSNSKVLVK
ncbi:MAG: T9SS type A sorting domain-containing protein [Bacteroidota bacterium]|nr:T9SS type A sorting domain-containing protein [Bacteroidota bacterium]